VVMRFGTPAPVPNGQPWPCKGAFQRFRFVSLVSFGHNRALVHVFFSGARMIFAKNDHLLHVVCMCLSFSTKSIY
jgi:hypothetical protein